MAKTMKMTNSLCNASVEFISSSDSSLNASRSVTTATQPVQTFSLDGADLFSATLEGGTSLDDYLAFQDDEALGRMKLAGQRMAETLAKRQPANVRTLRLAMGWSQQE